MQEPKLGDFPQRGRKPRQSVRALHVFDDPALCRRRLRGSLQVCRFGVDQTVDAVLRLAQRSHVLELEYRAKRTDARQQLHDRVEILEVQNGAALAPRELRLRARAAQHPLQPFSDALATSYELEMVTVRARRERTAGEKRGANLDQAIAFMHRFRWNRSQTLGKRDCESRQPLQTRGSARLDRMRFALFQQRPEEPGDRVPVRDELVARASIEGESGKECLTAMNAVRHVARQRVFGIGRDHSHSASSLRDSSIS